MSASKLEFDYFTEQDNLAAGRASNCSTLPALPGEWVVVVQSTQTTGFAFEGYIEPGYGVVKELVVYLGAASSFGVSLPFTIAMVVISAIFAAFRM
jgi:hypothetical protein